MMYRKQNLKRSRYTQSMHRWKNNRVWFAQAIIALILPIFLVAGSPTQAGLAQSEDLVTQIDCTSEFPKCKVFLAPWRTGGGLTSDKLAIRIDGQPQALDGLTQEEIGVQVAFALDEFVVPAGQSAYSVRTPGNSGQPKFVEFRSAAIDFFLFLENNEILDSAWLGAFRTGEPTDESGLITSFPPIADWVNSGQINVFYNELIDYEPDPEKNTPETPLYDLIAATLNEAENSPAPKQIAKHIVVFTDGFERIETLGLDLLLRQAQDNSIRIHTVMLGQGSQDLERTLQKIAQPTGGRFVRYTSTADLQALWAQIGSDAKQNAVSLTLPRLDARQIEVSFNGQTVQRQLTLPQFSPPTVTILGPPTDVTIERTGDEAETPIDKLEPIELPVVVDITYPEIEAGNSEESTSNTNAELLAERLEYVEYSIGEFTVKQQQPPFTEVFFPIDQLEAGNYTIQVRAMDRLAGLSEAVTQPIQIAVVRPEAAASVATGTTGIEETAEQASEDSGNNDATITTKVTTDTSADANATGGLSAASEASANSSETTNTSVSSTGLSSAGSSSIETNSVANPSTNFAAAPSGEETAIPTDLMASLTQSLSSFGSAASERISTVASWAFKTYQTQPRLLMIPIIGLVLLLLFGLQVRSVRSSRNAVVRQNFATSDPPNNDVTVPEDATEPANEAFPIATLVYVRGEGELPKEIPLHRQHLGALQPNQWSLGRSYQESDEVIESRRISRLHATITEQHGRFLIRDEGSSGGTYITSGKTRIRRRLEALEPSPLEDSDTINFNSIAYRFEVDRSEFYEAVTEPDFGDETEPELSIDGLV